MFIVAGWVAEGGFPWAEIWQDVTGWEEERVTTAYQQSLDWLRELYGGRFVLLKFKGTNSELSHKLMLNSAIELVKQTCLKPVN